MTITQKINAFVQLGTSIREFSTDQKAALGHMVKSKNEWFTPENLDLTLNRLQQSLTQSNLEKWVSAYPSLANATTNPKKVGVLMNDHIPAAGFHDLLSVVMSGHILYAKLGAQDTILIKELVRILTEIVPALKEQIVITEQLKGIEAFIATNSDNSTRYLEAYFGHLPHIIRKKRNSVAILTGNESKEDLTLLSNDIFQYFGLGIRNVSKLFVPKGYDFNAFFEAIFPWGEALLAHSKYANSYEYHRALFLMKKMNMLDNNFLLLAEYESIDSPAGVMFFEYYESEAEIQQKLEENADKIQAVVTNHETFANRVAFGSAQHPQLWDYANGVDTMAFLTGL